MNKNILIGIAVAIVIAIGGYQFPQVQTVTQNVLGSVSTLDGVDNPFVSIGGVKTYYHNQSFTATSSFICSLRNPFNATSSIEAVSAVSTNVGISQTNALFVSTSTTAYGTSTANLIDAFAMGGGEWAVSLAKNTATTTGELGVNISGTVLEGANVDGSSNYFLKPTEYITWKIATTTGGTYVTYDTGTCSAVLRQY